MANGRNAKRKGHDTSRDQGGFIALPWSVLDCPAYARLSHPAKALLFEVARQFVCDNNGRMLLSRAHMAKRGWKSADTVSKAKRELLTAGFIHETVMGHRPNKASWYAVTWRSLDKIPGYDPGAAETFKRGAYQQNIPIKNASLSPPAGTGRGLIVPPAGIETSSTVPPAGTIKAVLSPLSVPPAGHHLEMPSTAVSAVSADHSKGNDDDGKTEQVDVVRVRESEIDTSLYDPTTGEYIKPPSKSARRQKQAADAWVKSAFSNRQLAY